MELIRVNNISKSYSQTYNAYAILNIILGITPKLLNNNLASYVVRNISFDINKGEAFGIIGKNGAGKSTVLQIIAGTLKPTSGSVSVYGRVTALLELGSGFNPDFTGIENIYLAGSILGITKIEMETKISSIIDFADIGDYINFPVRTYSTGMLMRVAFSVAVAVNPDLLVIDEALSVGDITFQQKCNLKLKQLLNNGVSLLVVTHDTSFVLNICKKAIWLDKGNVMFSGTAEDCVRLYLTSVGASNSRESCSLENNSYTRLNEPMQNHIDISKCKILGESPLTIKKIWIQDSESRTCNAFKHGEVCRIDILIISTERVSNASAGIEMRDRLGQVIFAAGLRTSTKIITVLESNTSYLISITFNLNLIPSQYTLDVGCGCDYNGKSTMYRILNASIIEVDYSQKEIVHGLVRLPYTINVNTI